MHFEAHWIPRTDTYVVHGENCNHKPARRGATQMTMSVNADSGEAAAEWFNSLTPAPRTPVTLATCAR